VLENRVLRRIFVPKRNEGTGKWRKLHIEYLNDRYTLPSIVQAIQSRRMWWAGHITSMEGSRGVYRVLVGKLEGKTPFGRPRSR